MKIRLHQYSITYRETKVVILPIKDLVTMQVFISFSLFLSIALNNENPSCLVDQCETWIVSE